MIPGPADAFALKRPKQRQVDAVAKHDDLGLVHAELDHPPLQRLADGYDACTLPRRDQDLAARARELGQEVDIRATGRDHDTQTQLATEPDCRHTIGIEIVRVYQIERLLAADVNVWELQDRTWHRVPNVHGRNAQSELQQLAQERSHSD